MEVVLTIAAPVFGIAILGYVAQRVGWLQEGASQTLSAFVFNFAVPALLFRTTASEPLPEDLPLQYLAAYYLPTFALYVAAAVGTRLLFKRGPREGVIAGMAVAYPNVVMFAFPVVLTAYGPEATQPFFIILAFHSLLLFAFTTLWLESIKARSGNADVGLGGQLVRIARSLFANPIIVALVLGVLYGQTGWGLAAPIDRFLELLALAVAPCALFGTGAALCQYKLGGDLWEATGVSLGKLVAHPLIIWLVMTFLFDFPALWVAVATLTAAMPVGINVYLFSERYGIYQRRAGSAVLITSGLAMVTVTLLLVILGVGQ